jgi:hypothetical protein
MARQNATNERASGKNDGVLELPDWGAILAPDHAATDDEGQTMQEIRASLDETTSAWAIKKRVRAGIAAGTIIVGKAHREDATGRHQLVPVYRMVGK